MLKSGVLKHKGYVMNQTRIGVSMSNEFFALVKSHERKFVCWLCVKYLSQSGVYVVSGYLTNYGNIPQCCLDDYREANSRKQKFYL